MFWDDEPFINLPKQHEKINIVDRHEEDINHDEDCMDDLAMDLGL